MKSIKKAFLLVLSLVTLISVMALSVSAADAKSSTGVGDAGKVLSGATAPSITYNGTNQTPKKEDLQVKDANGNLIPAEYFEVEWPKDMTNSGTYEVKIKALPPYSGEYTVKVTVKAAPKSGSKYAQKVVTAKKKTINVKAAQVKKKAKTVKTKFQVKTPKANKKNVTFKVKAVKKANKKTAKKIKVQLKGKKMQIVVPKKAKKGTYKITVKVPAYNYYRALKAITYKVVVK